MGFRQRFKDNRGIALFMVISAIGVLAMLVTEFTYLAQISQRLAYDRMDQVKAYYLAKSAYKISLLRLKAYQNVKSYIKTLGAGAAVSPQMLDQIWSFPLIYPIPTTLPGLTGTQKEAIEKFQKESSLDGDYSALIESESTKLNLNSLLKQYQITLQSAEGEKKTDPKTKSDPNDPSGKPDPNDPNKKPKTEFDPEAARKNFFDYLFQIMRSKSEGDEEFASEYRDFRLQDLTENIFGWVDRTYVSKSQERDWPVTNKKAPFFSVTELHMIPPMDERLYSLFEPTLTAMMISGIDLNRVESGVLKGILPKISQEEVDKFFKFRDSTEEDNKFKSVDDFYALLKKETSSYGTDDDITELKKDLAARNIQLAIDGTDFKITVRAQVNQAVRTLESWVSLTSNQSKSQTKKDDKPNPDAPPPVQVPNQNPKKPDTGIKTHFYRIY